MATTATPAATAAPRPLRQSILIFVLVPLAITFFCTAILDAMFGFAIWVMSVIVAGLYLYLKPTPFVNFVLRCLFVLLILVILAMSAGGWGIKKMAGRFPVFAGTLPRTIMGVDIFAATKIDPAMVEAKGALLIAVRKDEQEKLDKVKALLAKKDFDGAANMIKDGEKLREKMTDVILPKIKEAEASIPPKQKLDPNASVVYGPGTHNFTLKAGEQTDHWIMFQEGRDNNMSISSKDDKFKLIFDDGTVVPAWTNASLPTRLRLKFKVQAVTDQVMISLVVK